jgi:hypothetical protein
MVRPTVQMVRPTVQMVRPTVHAGPRGGA